MNPQKPSVFRLSREGSLMLALVALLGAVGAFAPRFFEPQPLLSLVTREAPALLVACGVACVMIGRQIDISVGSQLGVCSVVAGWLSSQSLPWPCAMGGAVATGLLLGSINGILVAGVGLPSIVVTLATMVTWREGLRWSRQGQFINLPDGAQWFGLQQLQGQLLVIGMTALLVMSLGWCLRNLALGRFVFAVGSDAEAAVLVGLRPARITWLTFVLAGGLAGLAGFMGVMQSPQVDPKVGSGLEMKAIAAAVVGGVAVSGGRGSIRGVFLGFVLIACVSPALTHLHVQAHWEKAVQGLILLIAVIVDRSRTLRQ